MGNTKQYPNINLHIHPIDYNKDKYKGFRTKKSKEKCMNFIIFLIVYLFILIYYLIKKKQSFKKIYKFR